MGACFNSDFYNETNKQKVKENFEDKQDMDRYENGHCYSGGIGMADGCKFLDSMVFDNFNDAEDYLLDAAQKWGPALFVRVQNDEHNGWYYGAWCSS